MKYLILIIICILMSCKTNESIQSLRTLEDDVKTFKNDLNESISVFNEYQTDSTYVLLR